MTTITVARPADVLPRLYLARFGFAVVWAVALFTTADDLGPLAVALLVVYPLFDLAAAVVDLRASHDSGLYVNIAVSAVAAVGLAVAAGSGIPAVLRVWGAWAIVAGAIQLVVAVRRRSMGGQWPMIASGGLSVLVGVSFVATASATDPSLSGPAGYATLGGIFFLVSALRLHAYQGASPGPGRTAGGPPGARWRPTAAEKAGHRGPR